MSVSQCFLGAARKTSRNVERCHPVRTQSNMLVDETTRARSYWCEKTARKSRLHNMKHWRYHNTTQRAYIQPCSGALRLYWCATNVINFDPSTLGCLLRQQQHCCARCSAGKNKIKTLKIRLHDSLCWETYIFLCWDLCYILMSLPEFMLFCEGKVGNFLFVCISLYSIFLVLFQSSFSSKTTTSYPVYPYKNTLIIHWRNVWICYAFMYENKTKKKKRVCTRRKKVVKSKRKDPRLNNWCHSYMIFSHVIASFWINY